MKMLKDNPKPEFELKLPEAEWHLSYEIESLLDSVLLEDPCNVSIWITRQCVT